MKFKNFFNIAIFFFFFSSCKTVAKLWYGIHQPKEMTINKMRKKYKKLNYDSFPIMYMDESIYRKFLISQYPKFSINSIYIFNKDGNYLKHLQEYTCSNQNTSYLDDFLNKKNIEVDTSFNLKIFKSCGFVYKDSIDILEKNRDNYIVIIDRKSVV